MAGLSFHQEELLISVAVLGVMLVTYILFLGSKFLKKIRGGLVFPDENMKEQGP